VDRQVNDEPCGMNDELNAFHSSFIPQGSSFRKNLFPLACVMTAACAPYLQKFGFNNYGNVMRA
jgi:hypothetical protein